LTDDVSEKQPGPTEIF